VVSEDEGKAADGDIRLRLDGGAGEAETPADESYRLESSPRALVITAPEPAGLFYGTQTLRQLLPPEVEAAERRSGPWKVTGGTIEDRPRYPYRGAMLDVARHFLDVDQVKRYIDHLAMYKFNVLHLHLTDDQGWRLAIDSWPRLAEHGGSTEVGGGEGGYYTKEEYRELVEYAAGRQLEVVPEIDMPGHTTAALTSYPELNCDGDKVPVPYTGTTVGMSSLCIGKEITYEFIEDVIREVAELTPGRYIHIGGDEALATPEEDYAAFMARAQAIVAEHGKTVIGWHELAEAGPAGDAIVQYWGTRGDELEVADVARAGTRLVMSPASRVYLDQKYDGFTPIGLEWAGRVSVQRSYSWEPSAFLYGAPAESVIGVEAPLWSETVETDADIDLLSFPRLPGVAEAGWSRPEARDWEEYRLRLAAQAPRWELLGIGYHPAQEVPWPERQE
jgi:hexosaminidase